MTYDIGQILHAMDILESQSTSQVVLPTNGSDYGSDIDESDELLFVELLADIELRAHTESTSNYVEIEHHEPDTNGRLLKAFVSRFETTTEQKAELGLAGPIASLQVDYDQSYEPKSTATLPHPDSPGKVVFTSPTPEERAAQDSRSPLERFRTAPRKPLSVTDLISPAWCELQYLYALQSPSGKKRQTPAMKKGSSVHKVLEDQVHETVIVTVQTREDHWGLRIWNIIQGLRTLRATGMTRELELWGTIDGQVVNGVIDELSYFCTDREMEEGLQRSEASRKSASEIAADQATITEFFKNSQGPASPSVKKDQRTIYLTDVKTRGSSTLPKGSSLKPTHMQLMIYRKLLANLASGKVDAEAVFKRYDLNPSARFSAKLMQDLSALDFNFDAYADTNTYAPIQSHVDTISELLPRDNLRDLWRMMIDEFHKTMPNVNTSLSKILRAEFRAAATGDVIGSKTFLHDDTEIDSYLESKLNWWRGKREAQGVDVEDAFKCRICEFADGCTWRIQKIEEATEKHRTRKSTRQSTR